ncbi:hypothetical protein COCC4DRAFT_26821 [Bipolaris maydis ATCC 48331]|uniref:RING-type domain-containing protein n=2 Tax=Cochliobolus heterostrophus TaxID=5016 RepID=M2UG29_COCH5|nr:uncharacterized protein COCC4DRAFT_26821 [Bipolaris maydis ATCC 48331]EMD97394.1 hypothetical protein COCHEDRAFT_1025816 [Bipolaris maydis C5]KAH7558055.1 hypothetical protein BM1_05327 [Bipolaris maydis]ENI01464.1 hypothetical protein COCC4DRAFT_26821 [Bipolaris maydis ATCC 48331]KAJ5020790.1 hypothetical protein J3E73DRAFT_262613 [Bipolaris maydis]KAJ5031146.1 hypothetical protein J3E73DRAFT_252146 [Bipolaris maydis]
MKHGEGIARLSFPASTKTFVVHTDLLCAQSKFFRRKFQPRRQDIEGECSICHDGLNLDLQEITFCNTCGGNFHLSCINRWRRRSAEGEPAPCPLCRQEWIAHKLDQRTSLPGLCPIDFEIYYDWLYTRRIKPTVDQEEGGEEDSDNEDNGLHGRERAIFDLAKAYKIGTQVEDEHFCTDLVGAIVKLAIGGPAVEGEFLTILYDGYPTPRFKQLMVELYISIITKKGNCNEFVSWDDRRLAKFFQDVAMASLGIYQDGESKRIAHEIKETIRLATGDGMDVEGT